MRKRKNRVYYKLVKIWQVIGHEGEERIFIKGNKTIDFLN